MIMGRVFPNGKKWTHTFSYLLISENVALLFYKTQLSPFVPKPIDGDLADAKSLKAKMCKFAGV